MNAKTGQTTDAEFAKSSFRTTIDEEDSQHLVTTLASIVSNLRSRFDFGVFLVNGSFSCSQNAENVSKTSR